LNEFLPKLSILQSDEDIEEHEKPVGNVISIIDDIGIVSDGNI
jgi:hypothetical protein